MRGGRLSRALTALLATALAGCGSGGGGGPAPVATPPAPDAANGGRPDAAPAGSADAAPAGTVDTAPATAACTPQGSLLCNPLGQLPASLTQTGYFPSPANLDALAAGAHAFVPAHQLWSDGLHKKRQVILPAGQKVDNAQREAWVFPIGTVFVKTFLGDGPAGMKPVETRIIRRTDNPDPFEQYTYDVYRWNESGTEATLLNIQERTPTPVTVGGRSFMHQIPSRDDCKKCHAANDTPVIGFDEIRLNAPLMPGGQIQLASFGNKGFFTRPLPAPAAQISDPDPLTQRVKGYLFGNCYHCHNGNDTQAFDMEPEGLVTAVVDQPTMGSGTAPGIRVVKRNPEMSILYRQLTRMNLTRGYNPMPPIGVQFADPEALQMIRDWILSLR